MVKIRLSRAGAKKHPYYHIIAIDERRRRDGRPLARLGTYQPGRTDEPLTIDLAGIDAWVGQGAQLSETVASLVRKGRKAAAAAPAPEAAAEAAPAAAPAAAPPAEGA